MMKLLLLRAFPLILRPAVIFFEGSTLNDKYLIIIVLPIAMMALTISSIPIHLDYFSSSSKQWKTNNIGKIYISSLSWLILISLIVLCVFLYLLSSELKAEVIFIIILVFFIEKISDEISRFLEFKKNFIKWFFIQVLRSAWMFVPIFLTLIGYDYVISFLAVASICAVCMFLLFVMLTGLKPELSFVGIKPIWKNLVFLIGSILPASYLQIPRILIVKLFPDYAHAYMVVSQLGQGVGLLFNVKHQIPYRKAIARRTILFQKTLFPAMKRYLYAITFFLIVYIFVLKFVNFDDLNQFRLMFLLAPIVCVDSLMFAILTSHLGYLPWFVTRKSIFKTYTICLCVGAPFALFLYSLSIILNAFNLIMVPMLTIGVGFLWLSLILKRYF